MKDTKLKTLIVDDSDIYRRIIQNILSKIEGIEIIGTAFNGKFALQKVSMLKPDLVTLDIEMPGMNGLQVLKEIKRTYPDIAVLMVSSHTTRGSKATIEALSLGAYDFVDKPIEADFELNLKYLEQRITTILRPYISVWKAKKAQTQVSNLKLKIPQKVKKLNNLDFVSSFKGLPLKDHRNIEIVVIGISTGGPQALTKVIPDLPGNLGVPIIVVQHMPEMFTVAMAESLNKKSKLTVVEGKTGDIPVPGTVYIARGEKQTKVIVNKKTGKKELLLTSDPPENYCRPSADYLFRSIAEIYKNRALGVIMTGMGADGAKGLRQMKDTGALAIAQDEDSCTVFGMPLEAIKLNAYDIIVPLEKIAEEITYAVKMLSDLPSI